MLLILYWVYLVSALLPEQLHLSWTENENEMRITWVQREKQLYSVASYKVKSCNGKAENFSNWEILSAEVKEFDAGAEMARIIWIATAIFQGIRQECDYVYRVGNLFEWSAEYEFHGITPGPSSLDLVPKIAIFGDWSSKKEGDAARKHLAKTTLEDRFDAVLHLGDIAYNMWDQQGYRADDFGNNKQETAARRPYMTVPGNHEIKNRNGTHYKERYNMPYNEANQGLGEFYGFQLGPAYFIMIKAENFFYEMENTQQNMLNWIEKELAFANEQREEVPWLFMLMHNPVYCSPNWRLPLVKRTGGPRYSHDCAFDVLVMQNMLEGMMNRYKVDVVFQAHVHRYERNTAIYRNETVPCDYEDFHIYQNANAPIYVTTGNAGNDEGYKETTPTPNKYVVYQHKDFCYGILTVHNKTHIYYEQYNVEDDTMMDWWWVSKNRTTYN